MFGPTSREMLWKLQLYTAIRIMGKCLEYARDGELPDGPRKGYLEKEFGRRIAVLVMDMWKEIKDWTNKYFSGSWDDVRIHILPPPVYDIQQHNWNERYLNDKAPHFLFQQNKIAIAFRVISDPLIYTERWLWANDFEDETERAVAVAWARHIRCELPYLRVSNREPNPLPMPEVCLCVQLGRAQKMTYYAAEEKWIGIRDCSIFLDTPTYKLYQKYLKEHNNGQSEDQD